MSRKSPTPAVPRPVAETKDTATSDAAIRGCDPVQTAARTIIGRQVRRLRENEAGTRLGEDPEPLHDFRVAVRRLRAAVRTFGPALPTRLRAYLRKELRWLGQLTGGVRDLDVQIERLRQRGVKRPAEDAALSSFREYLNAERARQRRNLLAAFASARYASLLARMEKFAAGRRGPGRRETEADELVALAGRRQIADALRRLRRRGNKVHGTPSPEDLHVLRIRTKRVRYQIEFLDEIAGRAGRRSVKRLIALQDLLGAYHDAVVAAESVERYVEGPGAHLEAATRRGLRAFATAQRRRAERQRGRFRRAWERFNRRRTREEFRQTLRRLRETASASNGEPPPQAVAQG